MLAIGQIASESRRLNMKQETKKFKFDDEDVEIKVPMEFKVKPKKFPLGKKKDYISKDSKFVPKRLVINFGLVDEDDEDNILTDFDPPIEVKIRYNQKDIEDAKASKGNLRLAYWSGKDWEYFTEKKHNFKLVPDSKPDKGGYGYVKISRWGDPPLAWGF
jgi:hypothetical protein